MRTLPINAGTDEIKALVIEWNELLAQEKYAEAVAMFLCDNSQSIDGTPWVWTPERLEAAVYTYGMPWFTKEDIRRLYNEDADHKVTSLARTPPEDIDIDIERYTEPVTEEQAKIWGVEGLDYGSIMGDILFNRVPLDGKPSDLTALFWIMRVNEEELTLLFRDLHVM